MRIFRNILIIWLSILAANISPQPFMWNDINRDQLIDVKDVILSLKELTKNAEVVPGFHDSVQKTIATIQIVAGIKTVILPDSLDSQATPGGQASPWLATTIPMIMQQPLASPLPTILYLFQSVTIDPAVPPPRLG
jgi:hypothetical protein